MCALPVNGMDILCLSFHFVERAQTLESHSLGTEPRSATSKALGTWAHYCLSPSPPAIKPADTTYLSNEETEDLQITTTQADGNWQKIKMGCALRKDIWGVKRKKKGRCKSRKDMANAESGPQPAYLESGQTPLESSLWFQWCSGVGVLGVGGWGEGCSQSKYCDQTRLSMTFTSLDPYSSSFMWVTPKQRHFLNF